MLPSTLLLAIAAHTVTSVHGTPIETSDSWGHPKAPEHRTVMRSVVMPRAVMKESAISSAEGDLQPKGLGKSRFGLHPMQDKFELCKQSFKSPKQSNHGMQELQASTWKHTSGCSKHELVLWEESNGVRRSSCCPSDAPWCSGCAKSNSQMTACEVCMGGYTSMNGVCVVCADTPGWVNEESQSCQQLQQLPAPQCTNKKYRGLSPKDACCHCGGGHQQASAFSYKVTPLVLGSTLVEGWPVPRTASQYLVDSSCELAQFGLTIGSATGKLSLAPGCASVGCWNNKEPFQVTCTLTARQSAALNASARLLVNARYFGYNDDIIFITTPSSRFQLNSATNLTSPFTKVCLPQGIDSWLKIDTTDGTLTTSFSATEDLPEIMVGNFQGGVTGGVCRVAAAMAGGINEVVQNRTIALVVLAPRPWTGMKFGVTRVFATVGEISPVVTPTRNGGGQIPPRRFSVDCARPGFLFDVVTGAAMVDGHRAFTLDVTTGSLRVAPSKHLLSSLETETADQNRSNAILSCKVYGHYEWRPLTEEQMTIQANLEIDIREDSCWTTVTASFAAENSSNVSKAACRSSCRNSKTCTHFAWQSGICKILSARCRTEDDRCINANSPITAQEKIANCGERKSCISVAVAGHWFLDGHYCPVGDNGAAGPVYLKAGITAQESYYLAEYDENRDTDMSNCSAGHAVLKKAAPPHDFDDAKSNYMELHGGTVACLMGEAVLDKAFTTNRQTVKVSVKNVATTVDGTVQIAGLSCTTPNTTFTKDGDTEDEEQEKLEVQPLVLDDPTTTEPDDHWLHPCQCFPMSWGPEPPVEEASLGEVPPQSGNRFVPAKVDLVEGEFVCETGSLVGFHTDLEQEALEVSDCELLCRSNIFCNFFWRGTVLSTVQCRLYRQCADLVREPGAVGSLMALGDATKTLCRIANPEVCWKVSKRREFLGAQAVGNPPFGRCEFEDIVQQCDHKLLIGGIGVEKCARCEFAEADTLPEFAWSHKRPLYKRYEHGQQVKASCWMERFSTFPAANAGLMTCVSGTWLDPVGSFGLSSFTCEACIQVVDAKYADLDMQGMQELFFVDRQEVVLFIDGANRKFLDNNMPPSPQPMPTPTKTGEVTTHIIGCYASSEHDEQWLCSNAYDGNSNKGFATKYECVGGWITLELDSEYVITEFEWTPRTSGEGTTQLVIAGSKLGLETVDTTSHQTAKHVLSSIVIGHQIKFQAAGANLWSGCTDWGVEEIKLVGYEYGFPSQILLVNRWRAYGDSFQWPSYTVKDGICVVSGLVRGGAWDQVATLPPDCRPQGRLIFNSVNTGSSESNAKSLRLDVLPSGRVLGVAGERYDWISLTGIVFTTATFAARQPLQLMERWLAYEDGYSPPTCAVGVGVAVLEGLITRGRQHFESGWQKVAHLPPDCIPDQDYFFSVTNGLDGTNQMFIHDGGVWLQGATATPQTYRISLSGISFKVGSAGSQTLTLKNGWIADRIPTLSLSGGFCFLQGWLKEGGPGGLIGHLPWSCRPENRLIFNVQANAVVTRVDVLPDGSIWRFDKGTGPLNLDGIMFALPLRFVAKTIPSMSDESKQFRLVQNDSKCLEEKQYTVAAKNDLGLVDCVKNGTKLQQMITADELPSLLTGTMEAVVRPRMLNSYSGSGDFMGLGEVRYDFDCGEGVMSSISLFAFGSHPLNGSCAQAALPSFNGTQVNLFIKYTGADRIFHRSEGKVECLTALKENNFTIIRMAECDDSTEQHWSFDAKHRLKSDSTAAYMQNKCAGVEEEKTRLVLKDCLAAPSILWNENGSLSLVGLPGWCVYGNAIRDTSGDVEVKECSGASTWSRGRGFATLSQAPLECPPGSVMKRVQKDTGGFNVTCAYVVGLGECLWGRTNQVTISESESDTEELQALTIAGMPRHALKSIKPEVSTGGRWVRVEYMYCALLLPSAVRPTGKFTTLGANVKEGVYCPTHRDGTGRPVFAQSTSFGASGTDRSLRLAFNNSQGKWCINDDCARSHALHPLQKGRLESESSAWVVRPVTDFDGNFEARGPGKGGAKAKKGPPPQPPKPPKLIKFEQVQPLYAEECKDDVFYDPKRMNEVGLVLEDENPENPCSLVAGDPRTGDGATYESWDGLFDLKGKKGGFTWRQARDCVSRQVKRDLQKAHFTVGISSLKHWNEFQGGITNSICGLLPDVNIDPFGLGVSVKKDKWCEAISNSVFLGTGLTLNLAEAASDYWHEWTSAKDCTVDGAFSRIFCDLHCIRDAVKQGDAAIMDNMKKSFDVMTENNQMLFEHYTQTVLDKMDTIKSEKASLEQISEMKDAAHRMLVDMSQMAARSTFDVPSKASILRALNKLSAFSSQGSRGNATRHFMDLTEMTSNVQSLIRTAQEESFSGAAAVAHRVGEVAGHMLEASQRRNQILGVFTQSASISKQRQNWLWQRVAQKHNGDDALELDRMGTQNVLLALDKTWWNIRTVVDRYLHAAGTQAKSYTDLVNVMDAYTSKCSASYLELSQSYSQAVRTEKHAHEVLLKAWDESVPLVGLLASQLCDGDAFSHFARSDIAAAKGETTRLIANKSKSLSVLGMMLKHDEICANSSAVHTAVQSALSKSFADGLLGQTIAQLQVLFNELNLLEGGFADMNIGDPHDTEQIHDAQTRVQNCLVSTTSSLSGHVQEVLREMRLHANC